MKLFSKYPFLVPTLSKAILAIVLFYIFGWIVRPMTIFVTDWYPVGYPFTIRAGGFCPPTYVCVEFRWIALILDIVFWYVLVSLIIHKRIKFWTFCLYFAGSVLASLIL
jgi:hypothetical protein